ncbi:DUF1476 domain-containing protein [Maritalea porphyrae]|uniref:DUF1476 domain-containing protein n=1 Tax=Maritalea porphyrae TaxID=880732 RepID=A0ABQ5UV55_9HYPH|nr:DUF1476 domain-containing protein [Maritalea porphyrae]GLQ18774.1 hypothetical protein GCM10007879_30230 [Maritalea porphyrae]
MSGFDDREKAAEAKFVHDEATKFKIEARRNKLLGQWAAEQLGMSAASEIEAYVGEVISSDFEEAGDEDVFRKVRGDFDAKGVSISDDDLRSKMKSLYAEVAETFKPTN